MVSGERKRSGGDRCRLDVEPRLERESIVLDVSSVDLRRVCIVSCIIASRLDAEERDGLTGEEGFGMTPFCHRCLPCVRRDRGQCLKLGEKRGATQPCSSPSLQYSNRPT